MKNISITDCLLASVFFGLMIYSFRTPAEPASSKRVQYENVQSQHATDISILTVDSCEYVYFNRSGGKMLVHKGDCKNHKK